MRKKTVHLFMCAVVAAALGTFGTLAQAVPVTLAFDPVEFEGTLGMDIDQSCFQSEGTHDCLVNFQTVDFTDIFGNHWVTGTPFSSDSIAVNVVNGQFFAFAATLTPPFFSLENNDFLFAFVASNGCSNPSLMFELPGEGNNFQRVASFACDGVVDPGNIGTYSVVPEPGTLALLGLGLAGLVASRRRKPS